MRLRGAIVGFGEVAAQGHLPGWMARPDVSISAICEPSAPRRHHALRILKGVRVYDDVELMLEGERPDFVDIASPPALHAGAARMALETGAHVLVEKPLCLSLEEFESLAKLSAARSRVLMCVHNWKYAPPYRRAARLLAEGRLGSLRSIALDRMRTGPAGAGGEGGRWRRDPALGGGILIDHGWHVFYLMHWLMGGVAPLSISARLEPNSPGVAEEVANVRIIFPGDRIATAELSWHAAARRTSGRLVGEAGTLEIDGGRVILTDCGGTQFDLSVVDAPDDSYHSAWFAAVAAQFERVIAASDRFEMDNNLLEAGTVLAIVRAARSSSEAGGRLVSVHI